MGRKALYFKEIEHLLSVGYEAKDIVKITNIPKGTVSVKNNGHTQNYPYYRAATTGIFRKDDYFRWWW